jgi:UDP-N-acetylmuramoyl-L-alanyl-D-glutamate--2,6-diaminopimelate ligase
MPLHASSARGIQLSRMIPTGRWSAGTEIRVSSCCNNAAHCEPGDLFVAMDEHELTSQAEIELAIARGAVAVMTERPLPSPVAQFLVDDCRVAFGQVCHALAGFPSNGMRTVGIAGSYGKSTTQRLIDGMVRAAGGVSEDLRQDQIERHGPLHVARWMAEARVQGVTHATLELSPQNLARRQLSGAELDIAMLTNLHRHHAGSPHEFHAFMRNVARLFEHLKPAGCAIVNADDPLSKRILQDLNAPTLTFGMHQPAEITATVLERDRSEQTFLIDAGDESIAVRTRIIGDSHIYHCLAAAAAGLALGIPQNEIIRGLESLTSQPGCLQRVEYGQGFGVFVDSAQTPHTVAHALRTLRSVTQGKLYCVLGVGNRLSDVERANLGRMVEQLSDRCVITGPQLDRKLSLRNAHDILDGFDRPAQAHLMPDRAKAICWALAEARPSDVVLLCGSAPVSVPDEEISLHDEDVVRYWLAHECERGPCPWTPA